MKTYEIKIVMIPPPIENVAKELNAWGRKGWRPQGVLYNAEYLLVREAQAKRRVGRNG